MPFLFLSPFYRYFYRSKIDFVDTWPYKGRRIRGDFEILLSLSPKLESYSQVLTVRKLAGWFLNTFQVVPSLFGAFSIFIAHFTVTFTVKNLNLSTLSRKRGDFADFADFGSQAGVPDPSFDCKKVSGVVPEQVPGGSEPVWCLFYF